MSRRFPRVVWVVRALADCVELVAPEPMWRGVGVRFAIREKKEVRGRMK